MKRAINILFLLGISISCFAQGIDKPRYQIVTHRAGSFLGNIKIELFPLIAPNHTRNFDSLALALAFDSTAFHRVVPGFVIQGGDPNTINGPKSTWGQGNPNQPTVNAEFSAVRHLRGIIGAARDNNINSASSQFYICVGSPTYLDGQYTVFGKVTEGMDIVDTIVNSPRDANDIPLQKIEMFVSYIGVNDTVPSTPVLTSPANNSTNIGNNQNFQWSAVNGAVLYTVEFSVDSSFSVINYTRNAGLNSVALPNVLGNTTYFWRVKANNGGHESPFSASRSFTTKAAPQLLFPMHLDTGVVLNPVCSWTKVPGATTYLLQIATNTSFNSTSLAYFQAGITDTSKQASGLLPNTTYYWRVRGNQGVTQGLSSQIYTFTTGTTLNQSKLPNQAESFGLISVFPNPAKDILTLNINAEASNRSEIEIYNSNGIMVQKEAFQINKGISKQKIKVDKLPVGSYFVMVKMQGRSFSRKFEII